MNIGIIVHSFTGNTLSVAEKLHKALEAAGYTATLERVIVKDENPNASGMTVLAAAPKTDGYDVLFFGAPVRGFSLSPGMKLYLKQIGELNGAPVGCFVTQYFPFAWMGGNHALTQMTELIAKKGGKAKAYGAVSWSRKAKEAQIDRITATMAAAAENRT